MKSVEEETFALNERYFFLIPIKLSKIKTEDINRLNAARKCVRYIASLWC